VRVGGSTPPDNTRLTCRSRVLRGVAFPLDHLSQRWIKVFNLSLGFSDCGFAYDLFANKLSCRLHPRGQVVRESSILVITEIFDFRTTPRHSPCFSVDLDQEHPCRLGPSRLSHFGLCQSVCFVNLDSSLRKCKVTTCRLPLSDVTPSLVTWFKFDNEIFRTFATL